MNQPGSSSEELPSTSDSINNELKKPETKSARTFARCHSLILTECDFEISTAESYQKRLQSLRKELNYISETDWMYESLERKSQ